MRQPLLFVATFVLATFCGLAPAMSQAPVRPTGDTGIHDPSFTIVEGIWIAFGTGLEFGPHGGAVRIKMSPDGVDWDDRGTLTEALPDWIEPELGFTPRNLWAPSVTEHNGTHYLYYSASTFGVNTSAIGLATNDALDPGDPSAGWVDRGMVIRSDRPDPYNAIDPARIDTPDGRALLAFGSFWDGIRMVELDPATGLRLGDERPVRLASRRGGPIEAPSILLRDGWYYLFVSFDHCCRGLASTYRIMVGRAGDPAGPYLDERGKPMLEGGGTEVIASQGRYVGPGGGEAITTPGGDMLVFHYYDRLAGGVPRLMLMPIDWSEDGWPRIAPLP